MLRVPGVLQRFSLAYFLSASAQVLFLCRDAPPPSQQQPLSSACLTQSGVCHWLLMAVCVAAHTGLTFLLPPAAGCPRGYVGPGGLHDGGRHANCTGGAARTIDAAAFGEAHMYQHPTTRSVYNTAVPFDPEGLLGTLTTVVLVCLGVQAGRIVLAFPSPRSRVLRWLVWAAVLGVVAGALCGFRQEGGAVPVNKNLWSLSFVLATGSMAFLLFAIM